MNVVVYEALRILAIWFVLGGLVAMGFGAYVRARRRHDQW